MAPQIFAQFLVTDDLTILLGLIAATVFLLSNFYRPQPLVHPILLGRQSDIARVRNPTESAVYRNYATGLLGRFPVRPDKDITLVEHLVRASTDLSRTLWKTKISNPELKERAAALLTGLATVVGLRPDGESNVLLLLNDGLEFLLTDVALSTLGVPSFTIASLDLLSDVLDGHAPSVIVTSQQSLYMVLEQIEEGSDSTTHTIIVVGGLPSRPPKCRTRLIDFADVEAHGWTAEKVQLPTPKPSDVFSVSFYRDEHGELQGVQLTHENMTAGVASIRALVPPSNAISTLDTLVSSHNLSTPYGRAIAYTAVYEGASFTTFGSTEIFREESAAQIHPKDDIASLSPHSTLRHGKATRSETSILPPCTMLFATPSHLDVLASEIDRIGSGSFLYGFAKRHKLASMRDGFVTKDSLWDGLVFTGAKTQVLGESGSTLRAVMISGGIPTSKIAQARIALSIPLITTYIHPRVSAPIFASHALDVQLFPFKTDTELSHVGAPGVNVEVVLTEVDDEKVERGEDPEGRVLVRGDRKSVV